MLADNTPFTTDTHGRSLANAPAIGRGLGTVMLDRRTKEWRRRAELIALFTTAIGRDNVSAILAGQIEAAAELAVVAEMTRAAFMAGSGATADDVVRTANQAQRAEKALGIAARTKPQKPSLEAYLSGAAAA
ncbi:hypothetical protein GCM10007881_15970 [Mesorhizobium huakuii]|nr:hypothetical protein GCM10007881_15970 [Mesorhizobium huakuii]